MTVGVFVSMPVLMLPVFVFVIVFTLMFMASTSKPIQMRMRVASELPDHIKQSEENERTAGNAGEPNPNTIAQGNTQPRHEQPEQGSEPGVSARSESRDHERLTAAPPLRASGQDKWQPMRRDRRVEKRDGESADSNGGENGIVQGRIIHRLRRFRAGKKICGRFLAK